MNNNEIAADYENDWIKVTSAELLTFVHCCLRAAGADKVSAEAVSQSLVGASLRGGVDSHGLRLLPHYLKVLQGGRINGTPPQITFKALSASTGTLNGDDCFGHLAGYRAIEEGIKLADTSGMGGLSRLLIHPILELPVAIL